MRLTIVALIVSLLATSAWAGTVEELANKKWKLQSFGPIGKETPLIPGTKITLEFELHGQFGFIAKGFGGCNSYGGFCEEREDGTLSVRDIESFDAQVIYVLLRTSRSHFQVSYGIWR